ncbi:hypothetical protein CBR_g8421 [Chara braunii]|uniref:CCHC-type domain-containing protein n=1 Tax=Chara braunii TaxID=69332 RepID=A0A388KM44_CHABU|nr:hypothetical protein CBR_g8421 [Chara braunii]|eukprot:GBG71121.1 hypothetical protein CBR_g8421 [Chara braunii]
MICNGVKKREEEVVRTASEKKRKMYGGSRNQQGGMGGNGNAGGYDGGYGGNQGGNTGGNNGGYGGGNNGRKEYYGGNNGGNTYGRQQICYTCGKPGHYSRDCWMKKGRNEDNEFEEMKQHYRMIMQERREAEEKKREEEQRRIQEENERRREHDIIRRTDEMRLQLEAGLEEKWRKQTKQAEEAAAAAKAKAEEVKAKAEEAHAKAEEARAKFERTRMSTLKANTCASGSKKRTHNVSSTESESDTTKRTRKTKKTRKGKQAKTKSPEKKTSTTERGECSRARKKKRNYQENEDNVMRNANDMGGDCDETGVRFNECCGSPHVRGLNFGMSFENEHQRENEPRTPMENGYKGLAAKCSREGIIDYCLSTQKILASKKAQMLRKLCQKKGIKYTKKTEMVDALAREQVKLAYEGFEDDEGQGEESEVPEANLGEDLHRQERREKRVAVLRWLEEEWRKSAKGERRVEFHEGEIWSDGWKKVKRLFGMTKVSLNGRVTKLAKVKGELQKGVMAILIGIVKTKTTTATYLQELREMLRKPFEFKRLTTRSTNQLVGMYRAAGLFGDKKTKNDVRLKIDKVIRRKNGVGVRKRVVVKVGYDRRVAKIKIRAQQRRGTGLPTKEGHVLTRFSEWDGIPSFMRNAKNVTSQSRVKKTEQFTQVIAQGTSYLGGKAEDVTVPEGGFVKEAVADGKQETWEDWKVAEWAKRFKGLIIAPIDRNQGDTVVICPVMYRHAFGKTFVWNSDYVRIREEEQEILQTARKDFEQAGLHKIVKWKTDGRIGQAYMIPKDKDLLRWRRIAPANDDPASLAQKRASKALHYLIKLFPKEHSFYLNAIQELPGRIEAAQRRFTEMGCTSVEGRCYDIKDMFTKIPHDAVRRAVWQMLLWYANKGWKQVKVARRGKMCTISKTRRAADGYVALQFEQMFSMVNFDLDHAYIKCGDIVTRQVGIPMGKSSSPTLATITCAMAEFNCLKELGADRKLVAGWRVVDDIIVVVGNRGGGEEDGREGTEGIFSDLEMCYDRNLSLVRKEDGRDWWHFLGGMFYLTQQPLRLLYVPDTKNLTALREEGRLRFHTMQDFASYSEERQKKSTLAAMLERLWSSTSCRVLVISSIAYAV